MLDRFHLSFVTAQQGVPGDVVPWPEREVPSLSSLVLVAAAGGARKAPEELLSFFETRGEAMITRTRYNPKEIEEKWQTRWEAEQLYHAPDDSPKPKFYNLVMLPYPSGDLHIGHWYNFAPGDAYGRFMRMHGYNVMQPIGFDAFGLPAENAAISRGVQARTWTLANIETMRRQLRKMGAAWDWQREIISCLPDYYRWTEWLFLQFYKHGLAYRTKAPANWCPGCNTTL